MGVPLNQEGKKTSRAFLPIPAVGTRKPQIFRRSNRRKSFRFFPPRLENRRFPGGFSGSSLWRQTSRHVESYALPARTPTPPTTQKPPNYPQLNYLNLQQKPRKWFRLAKKPSPTPSPHPSPEMNYRMMVIAYD
ncbi:hypothetical protein SBA4_1100018 [Candidatus Sulfopaludibacter sp. SbA4]|nr:hypothetical protein SBA4_1100018 [Candidatus Sulfopaludibacter sp. SbA4]